MKTLQTAGSEDTLQKMGSVWVGGATGFLGRHLSLMLLQKGVSCKLSSRSGGTLEAALALGLDSSLARIESVDIMQEDEVDRSAQGCKNAILCTGRVSRSPEDAGALHQLHVEGTRLALHGLKKAGVRRVVVVSTSGTLAVSRDQKMIADETTPAPMEYIARWPYYRTKYYGEQVALQANEKEFEVIVVNPSLLLGPGDLNESSTGDIRKFLEKAYLATPAGGLAFVDVRDAAAGLLLALQNGKGGERYLLNGANMTLKAFFARLARISGVPAPVLSMPKSLQLAQGIFGLYDKGLRAIGGVPPVDAVSTEMAQYYWYCSAKKAEQEFGFSPRDPGETLYDTVCDLVERQVVAPLEMRSSRRV